MFGFSVLCQGVEWVCVNWPKIVSRAKVKDPRGNSSQQTLRVKCRMRKILEKLICVFSVVALLSVLSVPVHAGEHPWDSDNSSSQTGGSSEGNPDSGSTPPSQGALARGGFIGHGGLFDFFITTLRNHFGGFTVKKETSKDTLAKSRTRTEAAARSN